MNLILLWKLRTFAEIKMKYYIIFVSLMTFALQIQTADAAGYYYKRNGVCRHEWDGGIAHPIGSTFYYKCQKCFCFQTLFGPVAGCQERVCPKGHCWHMGRGFGEGYEMDMDCNRCTCTGSHWSCSRRDCNAERNRLSSYYGQLFGEDN